MSVRNREAALNRAILRVHGESAVGPQGCFRATRSIPYEAVDAEGLSVESRAPRLHCSDADVAAQGLQPGVRVTVRDTAYAVRRLEPDGSGMTLLILEEA